MQAPRRKSGGALRRYGVEAEFLKPCRMYEVLTPLSAFPPCGHDVNNDIEPTRRTYRLKKCSASPLLLSNVGWGTLSVNRSFSPNCAEQQHDMDIGIIAAVAMLLVWAVGTFMYEAPGWIHLLLTLGVSLLVWRIVAQQDKKAKK